MNEALAADALSGGAALLNALPHPILFVDPTGAICQANSAAEEFFQTSRPLLRRQKLNDFVAFSSPFLALVEQVWSTKSSVNEYGLELALPRSGQTKLIDVYAAPFAESPDQVMVLLQERTMAQMIERQLTHRAAARSVSGLASMLAHEIKNPLSGIRGAAQLLHPDLGEEERTLTQLICDETDRICNLVDRMEIFGDDLPLDKEPVNIHALLDHVQKIATSGFASGIEFEEQYDPSLPLVLGNRDKLIQALLNLVKNAAEAIGPDRRDGRITLKTGFRPGVRFSLPGTKKRISLPLMVAIQDNGPGIPPDALAHIFDPFVTTKASGSGLGLALVAKILRDHGGVIECESEPGRTVLRILLPMYRDAEK